MECSDLSLCGVAASADDPEFASWRTPDARKRSAELCLQKPEGWGLGGSEVRARWLSSIFTCAEQQNTRSDEEERSLSSAQASEAEGERDTVQRSFTLPRRRGRIAKKSSSQSAAGALR